MTAHSSSVGATGRPSMTARRSSAVATGRPSVAARCTGSLPVSSVLAQLSTHTDSPCAPRQSHAAPLLSPVVAITPRHQCPLPPLSSGMVPK